MNTENAKLIDLIKHSYSEVVLGDGISLEAARKIDGYGENQLVPCDENQSSIPTDDWGSIKAEELERLPYLAHVDSEGFRYYLPALMCSLIEEPNFRSYRFDQAMVLLNPQDDLCDDRYELFTEDQMKSISLFVRRLPDLIELDEDEKREIALIFDKHWNKWN